MRPLPLRWMWVILIGLILTVPLYVGCTAIKERAEALDWSAYLERATCSARELAKIRNQFAVLPDDGERRDQLAHFEAGSLAARGWMQIGQSAEDAIERVMADAELREQRQSPVEKRHDRALWCGSGCERDLRFWRLGAEAGAMCFERQQQIEGETRLEGL